MSVSLSKGGNVSLDKAASDAGLDPSTLTRVKIGCGWKPRTTDGVDFDLDAVALAIGPDGKVLSEKYFVYFKNLSSPDEAIVHSGDNRDGQGEGDDETITVNLITLNDSAAEKVVIAVNIFEAVQRGQNFGQVGDAFIRIIDADTDTEIARYDLSEDAASETLMQFAELYKRGGEWKVKALGTGYASGLEGLVTDYGLEVA